MIKDFKVLRNSTAFKVTVAALISFILYMLGNFLLPILLAVGLAFLLHPISKLFGKITLGRGTIHLSRVVKQAVWQNHAGARHNSPVARGNNFNGVHSLRADCIFGSNLHYFAAVRAD